MAAREYEIIESKVMKDSKVPQEREVYIEAYGRTIDTKPDESQYKLAMGSNCTEIDSGKVYFWDPDDGWTEFGGGNDAT